ncbi:MAG: hypothetical protein K8S99_03580 [Planctomycetes bacterium]|nr:hypothetical protein [Planctomycetota bacterium]
MSQWAIQESNSPHASRRIYHFPPGATRRTTRAGAIADPDLARLIALWPGLTPDQRRRIISVTNEGHTPVTDALRPAGASEDPK